MSAFAVLAEHPALIAAAAVAAILGAVAEVILARSITKSDMERETISQLRERVVSLEHRVEQIESRRKTEKP